MAALFGIGTVQHSKYQTSNSLAICRWHGDRLSIKKG